MLKSLLLSWVRALGYDLAPRDGRATLAGVLTNARACGLRPEWLIDVGAGRGDFAETAAAIFPRSELLLIEPLTEFDRPLSEICARHPKARRVCAVAASRAGEATLNVHPDLFGSSLFLENEASDVNGHPRRVPAVTLDSLVDAPASILLKIDAQGAELEVLAGAEAVLKRAELVILETSMFRFFDRGPLFADVVAALAGRGFALYDLFGLAHRPLDGALAQVDAVFAPAEGPLRQHQHYATPEQRAALTRRLAR
jgi:FkbM family methyltransferase